MLMRYIVKVRLNKGRVEKLPDLDSNQEPVD
jgi:hypothetical protein